MTANTNTTAASSTPVTYTGGWPGGAGGGSGVYLSSNSGMGGGLSISPGTYTISGTASAHGYAVNATRITMVTDDASIALNDGRTIDLKLLASMMEQMQSILCVIKTHMETLDEYPALQAAYEEFKLIEAIIRPDDDDR